MDIAETSKPTSRFKTLRKEAGVCETVFHYLTIAFKAEVDQVVVLHNDLRAGPREIESIGILRTAQIMKFENKMLGQERFVSPL